ncbi:MAG: DUF2809 domain-containing protein [Lachnospiraceae bacterium]|nr:DUF2809 domain-containing protein [Ruminococcus sp.]MCM1275983.1 DUF2809 domain-containing protein [Lachnospiraceae bacterium]
MKKRLICGAVFAAALGIEILIALFVHDSFVRPYLGDVLAVVCVYFAARIIFVKTRYLSVPVTLFAFCVELVQITNLSEILPKPLDIIVGGTFDFADLLCYLIGGAACFAVDKKFFE